MEIRNTLRRIGFSSNEVSVYLKLLERGSSRAGKLAKLLRLDRSSCYNALQALTSKGMVSYVTIGKVRYFQPSPPERIIEFLKEQQDDCRQILPALKEKEKMQVKEGQVQLYKGIRGIKTIFSDILATGSDNFVFGSEGQFSENLPIFAKQFEKKKKERGIKTRLIMRKGRSHEKNPQTNYRYINGIRKSPVVTNIYGDKIAIIIWTTEPEGVLIENKEAAAAYKSFFDFMWKKAQ
ncbi:MAG: helix-turn-helix domain-containing protein [Candidatus Woesearchaeota archaeon]